MMAICGRLDRCREICRRPVVPVAAAALIALAGAAGGCQSGASASGSGGQDPRVHELRAEIRAMIGTARDRVFPSLVNIDVVTMNYQGGKETKGISGGSGTIISSDGYVLTNAHVTDEGHKFWCVLADKQRVPAKLVGEDPWTDLAILKIDPAEVRGGKSELPAAEFGDSSTLKTGDYVLAMGSPFALSRTVTLGIVSNTERVFSSWRDAGEPDDMRLNWEQRTGLFTNWIHHDALINPGNSGGPLVNLSGEIIGVNTRGGMGNSFATPSNLARQVAESLIARGEVERSWIGATFRHLQNTGIDRGALVDSVDSDGPAYKAGLKAGDVLIAIDGQEVNARYVEEIPPLLRRMADKPVGTRVQMDIVRDGNPLSLAFETDKLKRDKGEEAGLRTWGITGQRITEQAAKWRRLDSTRGVIVSSMRGDGPAAQAEPRLNWGDVIMSVDGESTPTLESLVAIYERIDGMEDKPEYVMIEFEREGKNFVTLIKPKPEERPDPPQELPKAWIGVATQPVIKNLAEMLAENLAGSPGAEEKPDLRGFRVVRVYSKTEAAKAGLQLGDIITAIDGDRLAPKNLAEAGLFTRAVKRLPIDGKTTLEIVRNGRRMELEVPLERTRQGPEEASRVRNRDFELTVREITFFDREDYRWDETIQGVYVDGAEMAGWAGLAGISAGDVIQRIDDHEITGLESYKAAMEQIAKEEPERVVFTIFRGSRTYFRFVEPEWDPVISEPKNAGADAAAKQ